MNYLRKYNPDVSLRQTLEIEHKQQPVANIYEYYSRNMFAMSHIISNKNKKDIPHYSSLSTRRTTNNTIQTISSPFKAPKKKYSDIFVANQHSKLQCIKRSVSTKSRKRKPINLRQQNQSSISATAIILTTRMLKMRPRTSVNKTKRYNTQTRQETIQKDKQKPFINQRYDQNERRRSDLLLKRRGMKTVKFDYQIAPW